MMVEEMREPSDELPELRTMRRVAGANPQLEERTVAALRREGLLGATTSRRRPGSVVWVMAFAAAVAVFFSGWMLGSRRPAPPAAGPNNTYVLFLREGPNDQAITEAEELKRVAEYRDWAQQLRKEGVAVRGEKLKDDLRLVYRDAGLNPQGSAPGEQLGRVGGFFMIGAADLESALRIAKSCPHVRHGGVIEVRPIDPV